MHRGENRYICFHQYRCLSTETRSVMFVSMRIFFHTSVTTGDSHPITTVLNLTRQSPLFQNVASCGDPGQTIGPYFSVPLVCHRGRLVRRSFGCDRKNRGPVSQQAWHEKDPSLLKGSGRPAKGQNIAAPHLKWGRLHTNEKKYSSGIFENTKLANNIQRHEGN